MVTKDDHILTPCHRVRGHVMEDPTRPKTLTDLVLCFDGLPIGGHGLYVSMNSEQARYIAGLLNALADEYDRIQEGS